MDVAPAECVGELEAAAVTADRTGIVRIIAAAGCFVPGDRYVYCCAELVCCSSGSVYIVSAAAGSKVCDVVGLFAVTVYDNAYSAFGYVDCVYHLAVVIGSTLNA